MKALTPSPDRPSLFGQARVDHLVLFGVAVGTAHGPMLGRTSDRLGPFPKLSQLLAKTSDVTLIGFDVRPRSLGRSGLSICTTKWAPCGTKPQLRPALGALRGDHREP